MTSRLAAFVFSISFLVLNSFSLGGAALAQDALFGEGQNPDVRVEIRDLKRGDGGVVTLRLRLINGSSESFDASCAMRDPNYNDSCGTFSGVYLLDAANQKKYLIVRDANNVCVCSTIDDVAPGQRMNIWATFPAPPEDVTDVTVVVTLFEPIEDVPIAGS